MHPVLRFLAHFYDVLIYILLAAAALTGESVPSEKSVDPVDPDAGIGDRSSMLFSSALVSAGQGIGVVTATGQQAEIGRITTMLAQAAYLFNSRFLRKSSLSRDSLSGNPLAWIAVGILPVLQLLFVYLPPMNRAFGSAPISFWRRRTRLPMRTMLMKRTLSEP